MSVRHWISYDAPWWIRRWKPSEFRYRRRVRARRRHQITLTERDVRHRLYAERSGDVDTLSPMLAEHGWRLAVKKIQEEQLAGLDE